MLDFDFTMYFRKYEALVHKANTAFDAVSRQFPEAVRCRRQCDDCCYAMFDLSLIEAIYVNHHFRNALDEEQRTAILARAEEADRQAYRIKRNAYQAFQKGTDQSHIVADIGRQRIRCPLLSQARLCELYDYRPITCRVYGIPTTIADQAHTCGLSGFEPGRAYPSVNLDVIQQRLKELSMEMVMDMGTQYSKLYDVLVPLSMALLTDYDEEYLGISGGAPRTDHDDQGGTHD